MNFHLPLAPRKLDRATKTLLTGLRIYVVIAVAVVIATFVRALHG